VVSTTGGAIPHTVPRDAALLVPVGDADAFADALRSLLEPGSARRDALAAAARRHAARLPSWATAVERFAAAVDALTR
jgi:glycosyltransferase involved in cell wall biosynthesis